MTILAGDIGGTKTNVGLFQVTDGKLVCHVEATYGSRDYPNLEAIAADFLQRHQERPDAACFGIAGPIQDGECHGVNLPWSVDSRSLRQHLDVPKLDIINDLEATAYSLDVLSTEELLCLHPGDPQARGNRAVIAAGTGLGEAGLYYDGRCHHPFACEGGHSDYGVRNALEADLIQFLVQRFEHVSVERVLSGPGLVELYLFFRERGDHPSSPEVAAEVGRLGSDAAPVISRAAAENRCDTCRAALDQFVTVYGAEAGNLALKLNAIGGVYVGGGIAPKILPQLRQPAFLEAFVAKGRMRDFMNRIPVWLIQTDRAALIGAAAYAWRKWDGDRQPAASKGRTNPNVRKHDVHD